MFCTYINIVATVGNSLFGKKRQNKWYTVYMTAASVFLTTKQELK